jgi:hypothetical protein
MFPGADAASTSPDGAGGRSHSARGLGCVCSNRASARSSSRGKGGQPEWPITAPLVEGRGDSHLLAISTSLTTTGPTPAFVLARVSGADGPGGCLCRDCSSQATTREVAAPSREERCVVAGSTRAASWPPRNEATEPRPRRQRSWIRLLGCDELRLMRQEQFPGAMRPPTTPIRGGQGDRPQRPIRACQQ